MTDPTSQNGRLDGHSPYLDRPLRTEAQALRDRVKICRSNAMVARAGGTAGNELEGARWDEKARELERQADELEKRDG